MRHHFAPRMPTQRAGIPLALSVFRKGSNLREPIHSAIPYTLTKQHSVIPSRYAARDLLCSFVFRFSILGFRFCGCPILFTLTKEGSDVCEGWGFSSFAFRLSF